ncbi:RNA-directed DNA polymerase from mobile element jockey [Trichonephila clavipes]|nr:RNA-directed DNA polymerase from mobile element jockey [Trichonephila clavipes]
MALDNQTGMDITPQSPLSTTSNGTAPTTCEELTSMKIYLRRLQIICNEKERTVSLLRQDKGHDESDTLYQLAWNEYQDVQSSLQQAVSDFDSLPPVPIQAARIMSHPKKTARKTILQDSEEIGIENQFSLLPNVIIKQQVSGQLAPPTANISEPTTSANQKNGSNALPPPRMLKTDENYRVQNERPIKVVIKGFPKKANPEDIKKDLEKEGFEPERVTQLVGRRTKQLLPIFQVTLPRTIENLKIFDLKTLAHLNITVDGYNGRGVTQCFSCNNFHHNADNCYLKPRCLKCGEEHLTKDCPIKQRLETKFCINCQVNDRPTSNENYRAFGGTLILVKNSIKHYSLPTPSMQTIEATIVILTPIDHDPISIVSIYIPPRSDEYTFTIDIENLIQTSSNCVLFGDFNAPHTAWNCNTNSSRGVRLLDFVNMTNLYIAYPDSPTSNENWTARLKALDTQDNSLWAVQKFLKNKRSDIPPLNCSSGTAVTDTQKANILAESILDNFTENSRPNNNYDDVDELVNNTVNSFLSLPTSTTTETAYPSEIISYIKKSNSKKAPEKYYDRWKISINVEKSAAVLFTKKRKIPPPPKMYNTTIPWPQSTKYLGITFDKNLTWKTHIQNTRQKFRKLMFKLFPLIGRNSDLSRNNKVLLFTAVMRPILSYGCSVWGYAAKTNINILDTLQNSTIRMIVKASRYMRNDDIRKALKIKSFKFYIQKIAKKFFNSLQFTNNSNMINLNTYTPHDSTKRPRRILLDSYNPP